MISENVKAALRPPPRRLSSLLSQFVDLSMALSPTLFSLPSLILFPSIRSVVLIVLSVLAGGFSASIIARKDDVKRLKDCIQGYLAPFSKCEFIKYKVSDYATSSSLLLQETEQPLISFMGHKARIKSLKPDVRIYVVKKGNSKIVPMQITAFQTFGGLSFIFLRDDPKQITPIGRFFMYHEVGHASIQQEYARRITKLGWQFFLLPTIWIAINMRFTTASLLILALYLLLIGLTFLVSRSVVSRHLKLTEEVGADFFSINSLSHDDKKSLLDYLMNAQKLPQDQLLSDEQNQGRYKIVLEILKRQISNNKTKLPLNVPLNTTMLISMSALGLFFPVLGFYSHDPSTYGIIISGIFVLALYVSLIKLVTYRKRLIRYIESIVEK